MIKHDFTPPFVPAHSGSGATASASSICATGSPVGPSGPPRSRRFSYTIFDKLEFFKKLDINDGNIYKTAKQEGLLRNTVQGWVKDRKRIEAVAQESDVISRKIRKVMGKGDRLQQAKFVDLEAELASWMDMDKNGGHGVSMEDIKSQALKIFKEKYEAPGVTFSASNGWAWRFLKRHGFSDRAANGQKIPANAKGTKN